MFFAEELNAALLVGGALCLSFLWWLCTRRPAGVPPGPGFALPLLGHLHLLDRDPRAKFTKWRQQYGDIFSLYLGSRLVIVFNSYSVIREAFVKHGDVFSERPHMLTTDRLAENLGILLASGKGWKEQRHTAVEILRDLGMGKNDLAEKVQEEVSHYVQAFEEFQGRAVDPHRTTIVSVCNNISSIVFGQRYRYDDPLFNRYFEAVEDNFQRLAGSAVVNFFPFLEYLPGDLFGIRQIMANMKIIRGEFIQPHVDRHLEEYVADQRPTDFMFAYLDRMKKNEQHGLDTTLSALQLSRTTADVVIAGTETTAAAIKWTLLCLLHNPQVQEKCYQEIIEAIGTERLPTMQDRHDLVYVEATIQEVLRTASIGTFAVHHAPSCDVLFRGYLIPKDAIILPFMTTALHDQATWGDPDSFRPERFIDAERGLIHPPEFVPFSMGRRACPGESLARMELFLYISSLIHRFRFMPPEPQELPPLEGILGATHTPKRYRIRAVPRQ
ncbi:hypothetical protein ACOMHN_061313 [Nucella lapillus]